MNLNKCSYIQYLHTSLKTSIETVIKEIKQVLNEEIEIEYRDKEFNDTLWRYGISRFWK